MSPCHLQIWAASIVFNIVNGLNIGGWLFGYGPRTDDDWAGRANSIYIGSAIWAVGLLGNMYHENVLREIRREAGRRPKAKGGNDGSVQKVYVIPKGGLFEYVLYPHYLCEWVEWIGFWMIAGWSCGPVRTFVAASISNMTPTAVHGWHWYVEKFGRKEVGQRMAVVPGLL